ncbi:MAG: hypothetical protein ACT4TC_18885 [Myxococcaceae bacterium]
MNKLAAVPVFFSLMGCNTYELLEPVAEGVIAAPLTPQCPAQLPGTDEGTGAPGDPDFGCFGACGPSCNAVCTESTVELRLAGTDASGASTCTVCGYRVKTCKSHAFCRWHDDCYRQCDIAWRTNKPGEPVPSTGYNLCYFGCDAKLITRCSPDWTNLSVVGSPGTLSPECWDGSVVRFSAALSTETSPGTCAESTSTRSCSWPADDAKWPVDAPPAPNALPQATPCWSTANCPDPNSTCDRPSFLPGVCRTVAGAQRPNAQHVPVSTASCW